MILVEFTLKKREKKTLKVNIGDESFQIPLAGSLTPEENAKLDTGDGTVAFLRRYLSDDVNAFLTVDDYNEITAAWIKASKEAKGNPGES